MKLIYAGIMLPFVRTNSLTREIVYSEDRTTYIGTRWTIDISTIINPGQQGLSYDYDEDGNLAPTPGVRSHITDVNLRHRLSQPRQQLTLLMTGSTTPLLVSPSKRPGDKGFYTCDLENGPLPLSVNIRRIDGDWTMHVDFRITTVINECPSGDTSRVRALLANRFSQSHDVDSQYLTSVTTVGVATFRNDVLEYYNEVADTYRRLCIPPVSRGFRRVSMRVSISPNRNALMYTCVDQEQFQDIGLSDPQAGGAGIVDVEAVFSTSTVSSESGTYSGITVADMAVKVIGRKESSLWILVQTAWKIANAKINLANKNIIIKHVSLSQVMTNRVVNFRLQVQLPPSAIGKIGILNTDILRIDDLFGDNAGLNPGMLSDGGSRGSFNRELLAAAIKNACTSVGKPTEGEAGRSNPSSDVSPNYQPDVTVTFSDVVPDHMNNYTYSALKLPHTDYRIESRFSRKTWAKQIPVAKGYTAQERSPSQSGGMPYSSSAQDTATSPDASTQPDSEVVFLAAPTTQLQVKWTAERVGEPPLMPHPYMNVDPNLVLLSDDVQPASPEMLGDGTSMVYRVSGVNHYALRKSYGGGDNLAMNALPIVQRFYEENILPSNNFKPGIIGPTPQ